jgi:polyhydroxyalkanoate synthesis regulator phasin
VQLQEVKTKSKKYDALLELRQQVDVMEKAVGPVVGRVEALERDVAQLNSNSTSISDDLEIIHDDVLKLQKSKRVDVCEKNITALRKDVDDLKSRGTTGKNDISGSTTGDIPKSTVKPKMLNSKYYAEHKIKG